MIKHESENEVKYKVGQEKPTLPKWADITYLIVMRSNTLVCTFTVNVKNYLHQNLSTLGRSFFKANAGFLHLPRILLSSLHILYPGPVLGIPALLVVISNFLCGISLGTYHPKTKGTQSCYLIFIIWTFWKISKHLIGWCATANFYLYKY